MQEEVENKTINLVVRTTSLGLRSMYQGLHSALQKIENDYSKLISQRLTKEQIKAANMKFKAETKNAHIRGKQTVKELLNQGQGAESIEVGEKSLRDFQRIANKYGVDFAITKEKGTNPPVYNIFFKARDVDAIKSVVKDCTYLLKRRENQKESIKEKLDKYKEIVKNTPKKVKEKWKEQVR